MTFGKDKDILKLCKEHDPYVEAIVGAVYYDSNYDTTRRWILRYLHILLQNLLLIFCFDFQT